MKPKLTIIATPIGNTNEISFRAIEALKNNKYYFCEDVRVSKKLLNILNISLDNKFFYVLNAVNENKAVDNFKFENENYCLLSDAGYPMLSDPGYYLINHFIKNNYQIEIINGPSSILHSLVASGFPTSPFFFYGFLDHNENKKEKELVDIKQINGTIIIFESVHRIQKTLTLIEKIFGNLVQICVCRELTKLNETIYHGNISEIKKNLTEKGEFVILINNNSNTSKTLELSDIMAELISLIKKGEKDKVACKMLAYKYNLKSKDIYNFWQSQKNNV